MKVFSNVKHQLPERVRTSEGVGGGSVGLYTVSVGQIVNAILRRFNRVLFLFRFDNPSKMSVYSRLIHKNG